MAIFIRNQLLDSSGVTIWAHLASIDWFVPHLVLDFIELEIFKLEAKLFYERGGGAFNGDGVGYYKFSLSKEV